MKRLTVVAAGLGWRTIERRGMISFAGLRFEPRPSVFPAVTCVAQASLRTGLSPAEHGMTSNGVWLEGIRRPSFWEQSSALVKGVRIWGESTGLFFLQQSLGEKVRLIVSPAPIHRHGGGMVMSCYTKPADLSDELARCCGTFPLWRYWGPLASPKVGRRCIDWFECAIGLCDVNDAYLYLPTLDYAAQKYGPFSRQDDEAFAEFVRQINRLASICERCGATLEVTGDYEITPVSGPPVRPNVVLRHEGLFAVRRVAGMTYPDFHRSGAFALCDHEFCILHGEARDKAREMLLATGDYEEADGGLLAKRGSWCEYKWWTDGREAPDYAAHVDIHNKPGYDPTELFLFGKGVVKGTHGRKCEVAYAGS